MKIKTSLFVTALLLTAALVACSKDEGNKSVDIPDAARHFAWVGEADGGVRVVLEALAPPQDLSNARFSEESMLRSRLPLDDDTELLRLHLFGSGAQLQTDGTTSIGDQQLSGFGDAPADLDSGQRLLWNTVLRGLPAPNPTTEVPLHRSMILRGSPPKGEMPVPHAVWQNSDMHIPLQLRQWTDMDRGRYFDESLTPPKKADG